MEKKEGRKEGEKPPLEWKRLETGNRITPEFLTRRIPAGCSRNLSEGIIRKRSRRERERGRLEKPEEDWNGNSSGRTNGTMKFTRQRRFFFHFRHFQSPRIPFDCGFGARKHGIEDVSSSTCPCGNGQFAIVFAVQFVTRAIRLVKEVRPGSRPNRRLFRKRRTYEERESGGVSRCWRQLASPSGAPSRLLPVSRR